jgi:hypothetical protein
VLVAGLNSQWWVADFRVEQSPEGEGAPGPVSETVRKQVVSASCRQLCWCSLASVRGAGRRSAWWSVSAVCGAREAWSGFA